MESPIHDSLDGKRSRDELSLEERDELAALEATIGLIADRLRSAPVPDLSAGVMARIAEPQAAPAPGERLAMSLRRALGWLWAPRPLTVRVRPALAMAVFALISSISLLGPLRGPTSTAGGLRAGLDESWMGQDAAPSPQVYVQFRLEAAGASQVALAGSFTGWKPEFEMRESAPGVWSILLPLRPGIHDYAFIVDGERWVADPHALQIDDGFGGANSRIALPAPEAGGQRI
jgi:hypothetical protein